MAYTFPLLHDQFWSRLPIARMTLSAPEPAEISRTDGGDVIKRALGEALWQGTATLARVSHADAREAAALLSLASRAGATFFMWDRTYFGPRAWDGSAWPAVTLDSVDADNRDVRFAGLTFPFSVGDYFSFAYAAGPVRYAMHMIVRKVADKYEVTPPVRPGWAAGATVNQQRPQFKAILVDPPEPGEMGRVLREGGRLNFLQTLR